MTVNLAVLAGLERWQDERTRDQKKVQPMWVEIRVLNWLAVFFCRVLCWIAVWPTC